MNIHPTAIIEDGAIIGEGVKIAPYTIVGKNVKIGKNTEIGSHTVILGNTEIGENNKIFSSVSIGQEPQDLKYNGEETKVVIGDNNTIREFVTIHRGTNHRWETRIGNGNLFLAYVHIAHDCIVGNGCIFSNNATLAGHVEVEDFVIIGGLTPIHQFVRIGSHVMIGGASAVSQDLLPFVIAEGNKAKTHGINIIGLRRRGLDKEEIKVIKDVYKIIIRSGLTLVDAVAEVKEKYPNNKNAKKMLDFVDKSERGLCR